MTDEPEEDDPHLESPLSGAEPELVEPEEPPPTGWGRVVAWYERPATLLDLGGVGLLIVAALVGFAVLSLRGAPGGRGTVRPLGAPLSARHIEWLLRLPERQTVPAGIEIAGRPDALFALGEPVRLRISLRAPARVAVLTEAAGGPGAQAWPGLGQAPALVPAPSAGGPAIEPLSLETRREGAHRLRLVVAPADLDLGAVSPNDLPGVAGRLTIVDLSYRVARAEPRRPAS